MSLSSINVYLTKSSRVSIPHPTVSVGRICSAAPLFHDTLFLQTVDLALREDNIHARRKAHWQYCLLTTMQFDMCR